MANAWINRKGIWLPPTFNLEDFLEWSGGNDVDEIPFTESEAIEYQDENPGLEFYINDNCPEYGMEFLLRNSQDEGNTDEKIF